MSAFKRIIPGNKTRFPESTSEPQNHVNVDTPGTHREKKASFFRRPRQAPTFDSSEDPPLSSDQSRSHAPKSRHLLSRHNNPSLDPTNEITKLTGRVGNLMRKACRVPRYSTPHASGDLFRLGQLPAATDIDVEALLKESLRHVTVKKAAAARYSMVTALTNMRELSVLSNAVDQYLPYALTCWDIAEYLKKKGTNVSTGVKWESGLATDVRATTEYEGGFGLEAAFVLTLSALCKVRSVCETAGGFGLQNDDTLIAQIKSLQVAAGMFNYAHDDVLPKALADYAGSPPPELVPEVSSLFSSLSLCLAQALHVRRAVIKGMSAATLAKLSAEAHSLAAKVQTKLCEVTRQNIMLTTDITTLTTDLKSLTYGWTLQHLGAATQPKADCGAKITALRSAITTLKGASTSPIVGRVAAADLVDLDKDLEDAVNENRVMYQHDIPDVKDLHMPQGRILVSATTYDAERIPMANTAPKK